MMGMLAKRRRQSSPIIRLMEVGQVCDNYQTIMMVKVHDYIAINGFAGFTWRQLDRVNLQAMWRKNLTKSLAMMAIAMINLDGD